jgi:hypothetical protein
MKNIVISIIISLVMITYASAELVRLGVFDINTLVQTAGESTSVAQFMTAQVITNLVFNTEQYMCFTIPLNPGGSDLYKMSGHKWTNFEIKISMVTNSLQPFTQKYFWQSQGDPWDNPQPQYGDIDARCYFIDDHKTGDVRLWSLYTNLTSGVDTMSLEDQCLSTNSLIDTVIFYPSHDGCPVDWTTWQTYKNSHNLRASWLRYDNLGPEINENGKERWQPIEPTWVPQRKNEE